MPTTWDPAAKGASINLSNGNLDATGAVSAAVWNSVLGTTSYSAGKVYIEYLLTVADSVVGGRFFFGMATSAITLSTYLGNSASGAGDQDTFGWTVNGFTIANNASINYNTVNNVFQIAIDGTGGKAWSGLNNAWNGGGSPGAGTNPGITWTPPLTLFPAASFFCDAGPAAMRIKPSSGVQSFAPPSGFSPWDLSTVFVPYTPMRQLGPILAQCQEHVEAIGRSFAGWRRRRSGLLTPAWSM